jgi:HSP20 family protein
MARDSPFDDLEQFLDEFSAFTPTQHRLSVDVIEQDEAVLVRADLPGRDADSIDVTLQEQRSLTISAADREAEIDGTYVTRERPTDAVERVVSLPVPVDDSETAASYDDGVLHVTLPKQQTTSGGTEIPVE